MQKPTHYLACMVCRSRALFHFVTWFTCHMIPHDSHHSMMSHDSTLTPWRLGQSHLGVELLNSRILMLDHMRAGSGPDTCRMRAGCVPDQGRIRAWCVTEQGCTHSRVTSQTGTFQHEWVSRWRWITQIRDSLDRGQQPKQIIMTGVCTKCALSV